MIEACLLDRHHRLFSLFLYVIAKGPKKGETNGEVRGKKRKGKEREFCLTVNARAVVAFIFFDVF